MYKIYKNYVLDEIIICTQILIDLHEYDFCKVM